MTWCKKFGIHYLFNYILVSLLSILYWYIIPCKHSSLHLLHSMWLEFLAIRWLIHNQFMGLSNQLKVVVDHLLIGGMVERMIGLGYCRPFVHLVHVIGVLSVLCSSSSMAHCYSHSLPSESSWRLWLKDLSDSLLWPLEALS